MKKEKIKEFYNKNYQEIKQIAFGLLGSAITAGTMYYLDTRPLSKKREASAYVGVIEETGEVIIGVTNYIIKKEKNHDYRGCFGAWKAEEAIEIGNELIEVANSILNKENK